MSRKPSQGPRYLEVGKATSLSEFVAIVSAALRSNQTPWFRGQSDAAWPLTPRALRPALAGRGDSLTEALDDFRRLVEPRLSDRCPIDARGADLFWLQVAQHHGMPTHLLDWTCNAAIALYFSCNDSPHDGAVHVLLPGNLNMRALGIPRVLTSVRDMKTLRPYLRVPRATARRGRPTIALQPSWSNERIALQQGCFTLHGGRSPALDPDQAPGLVHVTIPAAAKAGILRDLSRVGVGEMYVFPEPEHVASHIALSHGLR